MKKMIAALVLILLLAALASCGGTTQTETTFPAETAQHSDISEPETIETTQPEQTESGTTETTVETTVNDEETTQTTTAVTTTPRATEEAPSGTTGSASSTAQPESTAAAPETTTRPESMTARRTLIDRIKENIDAAKSAVPPKQDKEFFNDAVFVGDSVTMGLRSYANAQRNKGNDCLGTAQFLCVGSMSYTNVLEKVSPSSLHPTYKGQKMTVEDALQAAGAGKVFIMLGMNDFSGYSESVWKSSVRTLIARIREKNPGIQIYIQSVTPIVDGKEHGRFSNENIRVFNDYLRSFCDENDCVYVDVSGDVMADDTGHLKKAYCGDLGAMGIHMSTAGSSAWANYLMRTFCGTE